MEIFKSRDIVVLGTGYSTAAVFESEVSKNILEGKKVVAFQTAFFHLIRKYGFISDVFSWSDPHSTREAFAFLLDKSNHKAFISQKKSLTLLYPHYLGEKCKENLGPRMYTGTSRVFRHSGLYEEYYSNLRKVGELPFIRLREVEVYTTKQMVTRPAETRECRNAFSDPLERFILSRPLLGTFQYESENGDIHNWGKENKLTSFILPMLIHLGTKSITVSGFDYGGPRFYDAADIIHAHDASKLNPLDLILDPICQIYNTWSDTWLPYHGVPILPFPDKGPSGLIKIIESRVGAKT